MKILVTGASGFIGGSLARQLAKKHSVSVLARKTSDVSRLPSRCKILYGDISDKRSLMGVSKEIDVVIHAAAALPHHNSTDRVYRQVNIIGTRNILESAYLAKVKHFIHISTVGIYDVDVDAEPSEDTTPRPTSIYSLTKLKAEEEVNKYRSKKMNTTIIRPTLAFGPYDTRPGFYNLFKLVNKGLFLPIAHNNIFFHTVYIDRLVEVITLAIMNEKAFNEDFIVGDDPCPHINDFINCVYKASGRSMSPYKIPLWVLKPVVWVTANTIGLLGFPIPLSSTRLDFITKSKKYHVEKINQVLGYKHKHSLQKCVNATLKWYKNNDLL